MAKTLIFEEQAVPFGLHPDYGIYFTEIAPPVFAFTEGDTYTVMWDGVEYICKAGRLTFMEMGWTVIGNHALLGGENTGEPFGIGSIATTEGTPYINVAASADTAASHTVAIWHGADVGIILKDRDGNPAEYKGADDGINVLLADGSTKVYVDSDTFPEIIEKTPVDLDFSSGNQTIIAPEGTVIKSAIIEKPANLIPDNIAEGVNIAGIVGALVAGGGGNVVVSTKSYYGNDISNKKIPHGLNAMPDVLIVLPQSYTNMGDSNNKSKFIGLIYLSNALAEKYNLSEANGSNTAYIWEIVGGSSGGTVSRRTETQITVTDTYVTITTAPAIITVFQVIAIGGLS